MTPRFPRGRSLVQFHQCGQIERLLHRGILSTDQLLLIDWDHARFSRLGQFGNRTDPPERIKIPRGQTPRRIRPREGIFPKPIGKAPTGSYSILGPPIVSSFCPKFSPPGTLNSSSRVWGKYPGKNTFPPKRAWLLRKSGAKNPHYPLLRSYKKPPLRRFIAASPRPGKYNASRKPKILPL
jgi:hypothetical protein